MQNKAINAYVSVEKETATGRQLEASVLMKAALFLKDCKDNWAEAKHAEQLRDALRFNQRLWSFFQVELAQADNPLPEELRNNLLTLSVFIDRRTFDITAYPAPEKLDALININMNVAAGLRK